MSLRISTMALAGVLLFCLVSCSFNLLTMCPLDTNETLAIPDRNFVRNVMHRNFSEREFPFFEESICFVLNQSAIWEIGDSAEVLSQHLFDSTVIMVDDQILPPSAIALFYAQPLFLEYDDCNNLIGTHGAGINYCLDIGNLSAGEHNLSIQTTSTRGRVFSYSETFVIEAEEDE